MKVKQLLDQFHMKQLIWRVMGHHVNHKELLDMDEIGRASIMSNDVAKNFRNKLRVKTALKSDIHSI